MSRKRLIDLLEVGFDGRRRGCVDRRLVVAGFTHRLEALQVGQLPSVRRLEDATGRMTVDLVQAHDNRKVVRVLVRSRSGSSCCMTATMTAATALRGRLGLGGGLRLGGRSFGRSRSAAVVVSVTAGAGCCSAVVVVSVATVSLA
jgi:hypothetical protein